MIERDLQCIKQRAQGLAWKKRGYSIWVCEQLTSKVSVILKCGALSAISSRIISVSNEDASVSHEVLIISLLKYYTSVQIRGF